MKSLNIFNTLPKPMKAYYPNPLAQPLSPAKRASNLNHIWIKSGAWRFVFDENCNFLFSGSGDEIRLFYDCSPSQPFLSEA
ncbi:hypothetical protein S144_9 [Shewanella sp. phage 1/44]|uniref:hypothetical protein n=1 Tax=Shewanella sp. phage 1/44 TaxID=1458862 RepID=UPI0004F8E10A|nr:hypothetical protein S144_9 [Shewanella sp. phage 1/44]AHK11724.1 hypothetical protein S144_9 [Shewanella sp. phage 1/44]